jgi:hypothetical protein
LWVLACLLWCIWSQCLPVVRWPLCYCMLKNIHTHFCNNKINMIKQQFNGKLHWLLNNLHVKHAVLKGSHQLLTSLAQPCTFSLTLKRNPINTEIHIKFLSYFGPAQERQKTGGTNLEVIVSTIHWLFLSLL